MMIEVPMALLGISDYQKLNFEFKVADSTTRYDEMEDFYCDGDVAPLGRLNYVFQNYIPGKSISYGDGALSLTVVDDLNAEANSTSHDDYGSGVPRNGGVLFSSINNTLVVRDGFGAAGFSRTNWSGAQYLVFRVQNQNAGPLSVVPELKTGDGRIVALSYNLTDANPVYLLNSRGVREKATIDMTYAADVDGSFKRTTVILPQGFSGYMLFPLAAFADTWKGTTSASIAGLSSFGIFAVGSTQHAPLLQVDAVYMTGQLPAYNNTGVAYGDTTLPVTVLADLDHETLTSQDNSLGEAKPSDGGVLFSLLGSDTVHRGWFGESELPAATMSGVEYFVWAVTNKHAGEIGFSPEFRNTAGTELRVSSTLAANDPVYLLDHQGNRTKASLGAAHFRTTIMIPQGFTGYVLIPRDVISTGGNTENLAIDDSTVLASFCVLGTGSVLNSPLLQVDAIYTTGSLPAMENKWALYGYTSLELGVIDDLNDETHTATSELGTAKPSAGGVLFTTTENHHIYQGGFGGAGFADTAVSRGTYLAFEIVNKNAGPIELSLEVRDQAGNEIRLASALVAANPVYLLDTLGVCTQATISENYATSSRTTVVIPQNFSGYVLIPYAAMGNDWNATTAAITDATVLTGFSAFIGGSSKNTDLLWVNAVYTVADLPLYSTEPPAIEPEPPVTQPDPPETETDPPETETDPPETETDPPETETDPPETETDPPETETDPPETETDPPETETDPPETETDPPETETDPPETETDPPETETDPPETETDPPETETDPPETETDPPETETDPPETETDPPETETDPPETETDPPETETDPPETETDPPETETDPPETETDPPETETDPPETETDPPVTDQPAASETTGSVDGDDTTHTGNGDQTTKPTVDDPAETVKPKDQGGCQSSTMGAAVILTLLGAAWVMNRRQRARDEV